MLGHKPFYHESVRKVVVGFGTIFNDIHIRYLDENDDEVTRKKVPLSYGPTQKFLARIRESQADLTETINRELPRLSYRMSNIRFDAERKLPGLTKMTTQNSNSSFDYQYRRIPVIIDMELGILSRTLEEFLMIYEQVAPFFAPGYTLAIDMLASDQNVDIPITINSTSLNDDYEGDFAGTRLVTFDLNFSLKSYIYGPITTAKIIRTVDIDFIDSQRNYMYEKMVVTPRPYDMDPADAPPVDAGTTSGSTGATGYDVTITLYPGTTGPTG